MNAAAQLRLATVRKLHPFGCSFTRLNGKAPIEKKWQLSPRESLATVEEWAREGNVGLRTGSISGVVAVDVDLAKGAVVPEEARVPTWTARTGGGGQHILYALPAGVRIGCPSAVFGADSHVEIKCEGGQVVAVGSVHPDSGRMYEWEPGCSPDDVPIAALPPALLARIVAYEAAKVATPRSASVTARPATAMHDTIERARRYLAKMDASVSGSRGHDTAFRAACAMVEGFALDADTALSLLMEEWNGRCTPPWTERELRHKCDDAAKKAVHVGFLLYAPNRYGSPVTSPRHAYLAEGGAAEDPVDQERDQGGRGGERDNDRETPSSATVPRGARRGGHGELCTELGNARRIVAKHGKDLRWTASHKWLAWDGRRWKPDNTGAAERFAKSAIRGIWDEVKQARGDDAERLSKWAIKSQKGAVIRASLDQARTEPEIVARAEDFDRDPFLFNVKNGTIELRTGTLREHRREDLLTRLASVDYDATATCPNFDAFLARVQPDLEVRAYLQRWAGYGMTGDAIEQSFDVAHGTGANGKSTFYETLVEAFGDYATTTPFSTFTVKRDRGEASNDLADLAGARLVIASEPPQGAKLNVAVLKVLTGNDTIKARFLYREHFAFVPTFKIVLVANHRPQIQETTEAAWRRVHLIPWAVTIPRTARDKSLGAKLRKELPGILRWALEGCLARQRDGLNPPAAVIAATAEYQQEEDAIGAFVVERCVTGPTYKVKATPLLDAYGEWAVANGKPDVTATALGSRLRELGFASRKSHGYIWWLQLALAPIERVPDDASGESGETVTPPRGTSSKSAHEGDFTGEPSNPPHAPPTDTRDATPGWSPTRPDVDREEGAEKFAGDGLVRCPASGSPTGESRTDNDKQGPNGSAGEADRSAEAASGPVSGDEASGQTAGQGEHPAEEAVTSPCPQSHTHRDSERRTPDTGSPIRGVSKRKKSGNGSRATQGRSLFDNGTAAMPAKSGTQGVRQIEGEADAPGGSA